MIRTERLAAGALIILVFALFALFVLVSFDVIGTCNVLRPCDEGIQVTPEPGECLTVYYMRGPVMVGRAQLCGGDE